MSKSYLFQSVLPHESALVDLSLHAHHVPLARVFPQGEVALVGPHCFAHSVFFYHHLLVVNLALQVFVVEIRTRI